jgi:hypothetical protein
MPFVFKRLALVLSIAAAFAADKEPFKAAPAASYPHKQVNGDITIAADPFASGEKVKTAFGKLDPYEYGVLPVLVVIQNDSKETVRVDRMKLEYVAGNVRVEATPAGEVKYARAPQRPSVYGGPPGGKILIKGKKNPLDVWEIEGRAFAAQLLPPGQSASGFFYFQTGIQNGSSLYLSGMSEAKSGKELFYFEVPLQ